MIGKLETVVLDTRDPHALAEFYKQVLGAKTHTEQEQPNWVTIVDEDGRKLSFQTSPEHEAPAFPDPAGDQQFHLDIRVDDADDAERRVLELGATRVPDANEDSTFRVFRDPAGHPFCLVWD
jgi:catechol 2,3-dioxygenase-like lactoylglutathione lyase family enzyme